MNGSTPSVLAEDVRDYGRGLTGQRSGWRRAVAGVLALAVFAAIVFLLATPVAGLIDSLVPLPPLYISNSAVTIGLWAGGNLLIALMIPVAGLIQWAVLGVRPGRLSSMTGRFRWRHLGLAARIVLPVWVVLTIALLVFVPGAELVISSTTVWYIALALITVPLQAAGEEYLFRGLLFRATGATFHRRLVGLSSGVVLTSLVFALFHAPTSASAFVYYAFMGACFAVMTQVTGGLEASVFAHATANTMLFLTLILTGGSWTVASTAGPVLLLPMAATLLATVALSSLATRQRTAVGSDRG